MDTSETKDIITNTPTIDDIYFDEEDIISAIKEIDPYAATPDGDIPAKILCSCKNNIAIPLMLMWTKSFETGIIPPALKMQFITPVYKKGNKTVRPPEKRVRLGTYSKGAQSSHWDLDYMSTDELEEIFNTKK